MAEFRICWPARVPIAGKSPKVLPMLSRVLSEIGVLSGVLPRVLSRVVFMQGEIQKRKGRSARSLKTLTSLNKESRPFFLGDFLHLEFSLCFFP